MNNSKETVLPDLPNIEDGQLVVLEDKRNLRLTALGSTILFGLGTTVLSDNAVLANLLASGTLLASMWSYFSHRDVKSYQAHVSDSNVDKNHCSNNIK